MEKSSPFHTPSPQTIAGQFWDMVARQPDAPVYGYPTGGVSQRSWRTRTYREVAGRVGAVATWLVEQAVEPGDRVAIIANSRPEWIEADLAIQTVGAISIPVYQSLPSSDVGYILFDAGATVVIVENQEQLAKIEALAKGPIAIAGHEDRAATEATLSFRAVLAFEDVADRAPCWDKIVGQGAEADAPRVWGYHQRRSDDLATVVYTSGTTGPPKGVMQTNANHLANVRQAFEGGLYGAGTKIFLFLPLAHSFARLMSYIGVLTEACVYLPGVSDTSTSKQNQAEVLSDLASSGAELIPVVPRVLEKMEEGIRAACLKPGLLGMMLRFAIATAEARCSEGPTCPLRCISWFVTAPLRRVIRKKLFGKNFRYAISGGAKLSVATNRFFTALEIPILEGYGLTETCVATNVNRLGRAKIGTVGPVLAPDIQVALGPDGEVKFRGPNITQGYLGRPTATKSSWDDDGWFSTGDLGALDEDGYLSIVGRKKELLVTAGGKKIAPEGIEARLKGSAIISQAVLVGEGKPYCGVLVTLNAAVVLAKLGAPADRSPSSLATDPQVLALIEAAVAEVNRDLASFETIKRFAIVPEDFTVENGMLTPTMKVKRSVVTKRYAELVEGLFERVG